MTNDENDIPLNGRRSIRDIPIPRRRPAPAARETGDVRPSKSTRAAEPAERDEPTDAEADDFPVRRAPEPVESDDDELPPEPPRSYRSDRPRRRRLSWVKITLLLAVVAFGAWLVTWHSANVSVAQRQASKQISLTVPVTIGGVASGTVSAQAISVTARAEKTLPATGEATVQSKAGGTITIVNDYSDEDQTLVRNTRFETPTGLIYRIQGAVTVPGKTSAGPGTVEARVSADQVGEEYNVGPIQRFTIPGFAGKDQFDVFYAESSGSMSGGFDGVQKVADPGAVAAAVDELTEELRGKMDDEAAGEAGAGQVAFTVPASFAVLATGREPSGGEVKVWVEAEADTFAVAEADFADAVAAVVMPGYRGVREARIDNPSELRVTFREGGAPGLEVVGDARVTWVVDAGAFEAALLGQPLGSFDEILARFGGIDRATPTVRPFWRSSFPADAESIDVEIDGEEDVDA